MRLMKKFVVFKCFTQDFFKSRQIYSIKVVIYSTSFQIFMKKIFNLGSNQQEISFYKISQ